MRTGLKLLAVALVCLSSEGGELDVAYAYNLSDFSGTIPVSYAALAVDREQGETYMAYQNVVHIFNGAGMETFSFGDPDPGLLILGIAVGNGDIFALVRNFRVSEVRAQYLIQRRNFRGDLLATFEVTGRSADRPELDPSKIFVRDGHLLLVDKARLLVIETDLTGAVLKVHDIAELIGLEPTDDFSSQILGFDVDAAGNMLLTVPTLFRAFIVSPNGAVRSFGKGGSVPGTFGVAAGITADRHGRVYVSDRLRSVVMVFGSDFRLLTEFGFRGLRPENLINPSELVIDDSGKLYVTQRRDRGVAVFTVADPDRTETESTQPQDRKEVSAKSQGDLNRQSDKRTNSRSMMTRSSLTITADVGPDAELLDDGLGALEGRARTDRRREEEQ